MPSTSSLSLFPERPLARPDFLSLLDASLAVGEWRYARRLSTAWLAAFPGDLPVKFRYAQAIFRDEHLNTKHQAVEILEELCLVDPEYAEAQELLTLLRQQEGLESHHVSKGCVFALKEHTQHMASKGEMVPIWARQLQEARSALSKHKNGDCASLGKAEHAIHQALVENPETPLTAVTHLSVMVLKNDLPAQAILSLAEMYHARWPGCLQFSLILADRLMDSGDPTRAVELLHQVVEKDIIGQVVQRLWGRDHPYRGLWPDMVEITSTSVNSPQSLPVPAAVAARLGQNLLPFQATEVLVQILSPQPAPDQVTNTAHTFSDRPAIPSVEVNQPITKSIPVPRRYNPKNLSEPVRAVQTEFNRLAKQLKIPALVNQDGRFPVYVIFTTRKGLEAQYGASSAANIDDALKKLARAIRGQRLNHESWGAILLYADDPEYTSFFEMKPAPHNDPWALKLLLADLDGALEKGGERIGAVLIVGGPDVVPFHRLPNPVDDADHEVLSDNPYTSLGENYFIQEWPIGRLPGGSTNDPAYLLAVLRKLTNRYLESSRPKPWYRKVVRHIRELIRAKTGKLQFSFGYTAAIWRRASLSVYRIIGNPQELLVSPPVRACDHDSSSAPLSAEANDLEDPATCLLLPGTRLAYFNLHGIPDSAFWYGHRDPSEPLPGLEFPVAIRPQDVRNGGSAPQLVFSEACYSAHIIGKNVEDALSLKFLSSGSQAVIGSTCISYGSISTPLSAADLLGKIFWGLLEEGIPVGEALRRAKLHLVREMHRRQGYLDPEDQKTIISFVLYGDPLVQPFQVRRNAKSIYRSKDLPPAIQTVSENPQSASQPAPVSPEIVAHVKSIVAQYLPGMADAQLHLTQAQSTVTELSPTAPVRVSPTSHAQSSSAMLHLEGRHVVSLSMSIQQASLTHSQYARLTMDSSGKLLKLTVSR
jgi:hypothetical protein